VTLDLFGQLPKHVDLSVVCLSDFHAFESVSEPAGTFSAGCALSATFVLVKFAEPQDSFDYVCGLVHYYHSGSTQPAFQLTESIEVHQHVFT
jgi:hypothetical protein